MSIETLGASLALVKEDVTDRVYARFFELCPQALPVMGHADVHMRGRMLEQVVGLLLSDEHFAPGGYLDWELDNHLVGYHVQSAMYAPFFQAVLEIVQASLGADFTADMSAAWRDRIGMILRQVDAARSAEQ